MPSFKNPNTRRNILAKLIENIVWSFGSRFDTNINVEDLFEKIYYKNKYVEEEKDLKIDSK